MLRVLLLVLPLVLAVYCLVQVAQSDDAQVRLLPRWGWAVAILLLPLAGSLGWLVAGRPVGPAPRQRRPPAGPPRPVGPDDDPDFLRRLRPEGDR